MSYLWQFIKFIVKFFWRLLCFVRDLVLNIAFLVIVFIVGAIYLSSIHNQTPPIVPQDGLLLVNLTGQLVDETNENLKLKLLLNELSGKYNPQLQQNSQFDIVERIRQAKDDNKITGMLLQLDNFIGGDKPALDYVAKAITEFKNSKKPVIAYGINFTQSQYYLASFADKIYMAPQGAVMIEGLSASTLYYRDFLEKIKAKTYIYRVGTYKSAVEPLMRNDMSPEAKQNTQRWLNLMWQDYVNEMATNRGLSPKDIAPNIDELYQQMKQVAGDTTAYALKHKLVDKVLLREELDTLLKKSFGERGNYVKSVSLYDYQPQISQSNANKIAVVFVNGTISNGESDTNIAGDTTIIRQLRHARFDKQVKAVILRVNSPGGGVSASEQIRNELVSLRNSGKPIVVSMGGVAASGGYWISTPANMIIANPDTITGSIGIFGVITSFQQSLDSIGIHADGVSTSPLADLSLAQDVPDSVSRLIQLQIENGYATFLQLVANATNKTIAEIDKIAQGQVWIGSDAKKYGLVDQLGDFDDAVTQAATLANLHEGNYSLIWITEQPTLMTLLYNSLNANMQSSIINAIQAVVPPGWFDAITAVNQSTTATIPPDPTNKYIYCLECGYSK